MPHMLLDCLCLDLDVLSALEYAAEQWQPQLAPAQMDAIVRKTQDGAVSSRLAKLAGSCRGIQQGLFKDCDEASNPTILLSLQSVTRMIFFWLL